MRFHPVALVSLLVAAAGSALLYVRLPEAVPVHWGLDGQPNRWLSPERAAVEGWLIALATYVALWALRAGLLRWGGAGACGAFRVGVGGTVLGLCVTLAAALHLAVLASAAGWSMPLEKTAVLVGGVLLVVAGNAMGRLRPNRFAGVRTPWTLQNDEVWRRTNRVGGRLFVAAGFAFVVLAALPLGGVALAVAALALLWGVAAYLWLYSRRAFLRFGR